MSNKTHPVIAEIVTNFEEKYGKRIGKEDVDLLDKAYRLGLRKGQTIGEQAMSRKIKSIFNRIDLK